MKLSHKILGAAAGVMVLGASSFSLAQAADNPMVTMEQLLPSGIDAVYTLDTSAENPFEGWFKDIVMQNMNMEDGTNESDMALFNTIIDDNRLVFAMDMPKDEANPPVTLADPQMYVGFQATDDDFKALYEKAKTEMTITEVNYNGQTLYVGEDDSVALHLNGLFIMTSNQDNAKAVVDRFQGTRTDSLANDTNFQEVMTHDKADAFFMMYVNPMEMSDQMTMVFDQLKESFPEFAELNQNLVQALEGEGIWVSQTETGFQMNVVVEGNNQKLTDLNLNFNKNNFTPRLWQKISGEGLIMYCEQNLANSWMTDFNKVWGSMLMGNEDFLAWKTAFKKDSGVDFDADIMSLMKDQQMMTWHKSSQIIPALTWIVDVSSHQSTTASRLTMLNEYIKKQMAKAETEMGVEFFNSEIANVNRVAYYKNSFNISAILGKNMGDDETLQKIAANLQLNIYMGVNNEGLLVVSTNENFGTLMDHAMTDNTLFASAFPNLNQSVADIGFFDATELTNYISMIMQDFDAPEEVQTHFTEFMTPFHETSWMSWADSDTVWGTMNMNVDVEGLANTFKMASDWFTVDTTSREPIPASPFSPTPNYCDVSENDWFFPYVVDLSQMDIVRGYPDGCFYPNKNVTRAEFIAMVMRTVKNSASVYDLSTVKKYFTDVPQNPSVDVPNDPSIDLYLEINQAAGEGFIHGYTDGSFRPNSQISRAEAVQILYNMSHNLPTVNTLGQSLESLNTFSDVHSTDWFFTPIVAAHYYNLVDGVTPISFEPVRNLTRAEAAKIIDGFFNLEKGE